MAVLGLPSQPLLQACVPWAGHPTLDPPHVMPNQPRLLCEFTSILNGRSDKTARAADLGGSCAAQDALMARGEWRWLRGGRVGSAPGLVPDLPCDPAIRAPQPPSVAIGCSSCCPSFSKIGAKM
ncbi:hypothetical protein H8959_007208 [Pygathrix nigripes]